VDVCDKDVENYFSYFDKEQLLQCVNSDCVNGGSDDDDDDDDSRLGPGATPFQKIASKMTNLTQDGKVKKRVC
jgi:hypothetical protein